jgi:hypothetical protein
MTFHLPHFIVLAVLWSATVYDAYRRGKKRGERETVQRFRDLAHSKKHHLG